MAMVDYEVPKAGGDWRIIHTRQDDEEVFVARPVGFGKSGHGAGFLAMAAVGLLLGCVGAFLLLTGETGWSVPRSWPLLISASIGALGLVMAVVGAHLAYTSTAFVMTRDSLRIVRTGPVVGRRTHVWPLETITRLEVDDISYQCESNSVCRELYRLEIQFRDGGRKTYLTGYGKGELAWLAGVINELISGRGEQASRQGVSDGDA